MITREIIDDALRAHGFWKMRLRTMIHSGKFDTLVETIRKDDQCQFGKWLYGGSLSATEMHGYHYQSVVTLHRRFHTVAASVAQSVADGKPEDARKLMAVNGEYTQASAKLEEALNEWRKTIV